MIEKYFIFLFLIHIIMGIIKLWADLEALVIL